jgi:hypothetical protein
MASMSFVDGFYVPDPAPPLEPFWDGGPPEIALEYVTPSVDEVAALERTRTVTSEGDDLATFGADTRPSDAEVRVLIEQAVDEVLGRLPSNIDPYWYPAIRRVVSMRVAGLIEMSYFREQALASVESAGAGWTNRFTAGLDALSRLIPGLTLTA